MVYNQPMDITCRFCSSKMHIEQATVTIPERLSRIKHFLKPAELAEILGVSPISVYKRAAANRIPGAIRFGTSVRFDPGIVAQWLKKH